MTHFQCHHHFFRFDKKDTSKMTVTKHLRLFEIYHCRGKRYKVERFRLLSHHIGQVGWEKRYIRDRSSDRRDERLLNLQIKVQRSSAVLREPCIQCYLPIIGPQTKNI